MVISPQEQALARTVCDTLAGHCHLIVARIMPITGDGLDAKTAIWAAYLTGVGDLELDGGHPLALDPDDPGYDISSPIGTASTKTEAVDALRRVLTRLTYGRVSTPDGHDTLAVGWDITADRLAVLDPDDQEVPA
ncbi:hypothetical protein AB0395_21805 [Streptosporangium sp. NPDC051023]|uniref:hypothetical protein n=1 Tax=Streptosporangium sp. NPDC051023 TaxID=3155410 RepID=UPI00344E6153